MSNINEEVSKILGQYSKDITKEIEDALSSIGPEDLREASIYLTKAGGKMLRPSLTVLVSESVGGTITSSIKAAAAIELIHTFSLIHDDIMDKDDMRRGKPSVHKVWGEPVAILAGDTLFSKAYELVIKSKDEINSNNPEECLNRVNRTLSTVADACVKICEGQAQDMGFEGNFDVNEEEYLEMIFKKTGALIAAATESGAIMGGADAKTVSAMYDYGKLIGLAFQIQDDYLDLVSDVDSLGKPVGSDIAEGKMTIIVVNALNNANEEDKNRLIEILKIGNESGNCEQVYIDEAMEIFEKYGSIQYAQDVALANVKKAKELLEVLPDSEAKYTLSLIADFVLQRKN
ncbi:polyprenyl synthetase family protein [Methanobrevibacter sp. TMH8]|uniref:short chain isoprenyl diphosphate synthase IdsA n=1 Tax=Methanobrevibacter sp. TMH8 TaxID=2848611 RepID=UPI001CCB462B|nr:short chain isoprenyl diphosphate synthase IdsA [Methanobrevibacter sp. TMH8]MBZ9571560.1 polyprenyl synthetase family protein [Methanobrevibacter sp. TMH8]